MSIARQIEQKLVQAFAPQHLELTNESFRHAVPAGAESHFKLVIVSDHFEGKPLLARHRALNAVLAEELDQIHALALHTYTVADWQQRFGAAPMSPPCMGGGSSRDWAAPEADA